MASDPAWQQHLRSETRDFTGQQSFKRESNGSTEVSGVHPRGHAALQCIPTAACHEPLLSRIVWQH